MLSTSDINPKWDLTSLLKSDNDPVMNEKLQRSVDKCKEFIEKWQYRTDYLTEAVSLKEALDDYEEISAKYGITGDIGYYFELRSALNQNDASLKAHLGKISEIEDTISNEIAFFTHRLSKIEFVYQEQFLSNPLLSIYKHFLSHLFANAKYLLTEAEEKILNLKFQTSYENWVKLTSDFIAKEVCTVVDREGNKVTKNFSETLTLINEKNVAVRTSATVAANDVLSKHADLAEAELNSILLDKKINDELRHMDRPDLAQHLSDDIDSNSVDALIAAVSSRYDLSHKYFKLLSKFLEIPKLTYFEKNLTYGDLDKEYTFDSAVDIVSNAFVKLDSEFQSIFEKMLKNGQIDVFPQQGKGVSQFCVHGLKNQPVYILLSYGNKLEDVTTLAHEMGHAINNELINKSQHALNYETPLCTAEVASTFMEDFALDELESRLGEDARLSILMTRVSDAVNTIFRQIACYQFEQELHTLFRLKGYLTKDEIGQLFVKHMKNYLGDSVEMVEGSENWWVYWSHIRSYFYVYSYASGVLISKSLQSMVKSDPSTIIKVKEFLSAGTSDSPYNIFSKVGVDISDPDFWKMGLAKIETQLDEIEALGKKLGKIN